MRLWEEGEKSIRVNHNNTVMLWYYHNMIVWYYGMIWWYYATRILSDYHIFLCYNALILWHYATMILWDYDTMRRYHGTMVWVGMRRVRVWEEYDTMLLWYSDTVIPSQCDRMTLWYSDTMLPWDFEILGDYDNDALMLFYYETIIVWDYEAMREFMGGQTYELWEYATMILKPCDPMIRSYYEIMRRGWEEYKSKSL